MIVAAPLMPAEHPDFVGMAPYTEPEFLEQLRRIGVERYHSLHPFHQLLHNGQLNHGQVQAWALNRYYYQWSIPRKDLTVMARIDDLELRREWRSRVIDHEGDVDGVGGIAKYLQLCERVGLDLEYVKSLKGLLPASKFAVDAYVNFVQSRSTLEAIASSLTELYAPEIHKARIAGLSRHYEWADDYALAYFKKRIGEATRDVDFGRKWVLDHAQTRSQQEAVLSAVRFKTDVLWAQLDALYAAYVAPAHVPPGAFLPAGHTKRGWEDFRAPQGAS
jgi:pyrroloquinoline-quinone synthase